MKISWWEGSLNIEPESIYECDALQLLWRSARQSGITAEGGGGSKSADSGATSTPSMGEQVLESIIGSQ